MYYVCMYVCMYVDKLMRGYLHANGYYITESYCVVVCE